MILSDISIKRPVFATVISLLILVFGLAMAAVVFPKLPQELAPTEDWGVIIMPSIAPRGSTVEYTDHHVRKAEEKLIPYIEDGVANRLLSIVDWLPAVVISGSLADGYDLAFVIVFLVLAAQFESWIQPDWHHHVAGAGGEKRHSDRGIRQVQ